MTAEQAEKVMTHDRQWRSIRNTLWIRVGDADLQRVSGAKLVQMLIEAREADIVAGTARLVGVKRDGRVTVAGNVYVRHW